MRIHLVTAARARRHVASISDEPQKTEAVALVEELEQRVGERPRDPSFWLSRGLPVKKERFRFNRQVALEGMKS